jgi:hypothetical protein
MIEGSGSGSRRLKNRSGSTALQDSNKNPLPLFRVYGLGTEAIIDRAAELENMQRLAVRGV